jgi:AraC-like DNA-binding protein
MLIKVNDCYRNYESCEIVKPDRDYKRIKQIIQYIHKNLASELSLDTISGKFFLSKYHLGYLFKKVTGFTVNEYIISRRIMRSKELLKNNLPVSQVGEMVGYNNNSHFIRTFKKLVGVSPKQYTKRGSSISTNS